MKMNKFFAAMALVLLASVTITQAQMSNKALDGWTLLGTRTVDYTLDRDVVTLADDTNMYTSLKFVVKNGVLNMHKATVHFANGDNQDIEFSDEVSKASNGRKIDLVGNRRIVNKVTFWYDTKNNSNNKSTVELWGKK